MTAKPTPSSVIARIGLQRIELGWFLLMVAWFLYQGVWFIRHVPFGLPPDEQFHAQVVAVFASHSGFFIDPHEVNAWHGTGTQSFFLYHWLLARLAALFYSQGSDPLSFLRGTSLLLSVGYLFVFRRLAQLLCDDALARALALLAQASLLMFVFISSAVSYDSLTNLCSIVLVYSALLHTKKASPWALFAAVIATGIGAQSKVTFLPLAALVWLLLAYHHRRKPRKSLTEALRYARTSRAGRTLAAGALLVVILNVAITGRALLEYQSVWPSCSRIYSESRCLVENPVHRKSVSVATARTHEDRLVLDPLKYGLLWSDRMVEQSVGIFAYKSHYPPPYLLSLLELVLLLSAVLLIRRLKRQPQVVRYALFLSMGFLVFVCYGHNYPRFLSLGVFPRYTFMTMQGRYAFPVLALVILVVCRMLLSWRRAELRATIALCSAALVLSLGFPGFMARGANVVQNGTLQEKYRQQLFHMHDFVDP